jgi:WD40 repeat protein
MIRAKDCDVRVWNVKKGSERDNKTLKPVATIEHCRDIPEYTEEKADIDCVEWSRDGMLLATGSTDPVLRIWDFARNEIILQQKTHTGTIAVLRFSPNNKLLVSSSLDGTLILWDLKEQKPKQILEHRRGMHQVSCASALI